MRKDSFYRKYFARVGDVGNGLSPKDKLIVEHLGRYAGNITNLLDIGCLNSALPRTIRRSIKVANYYGVDLIPAPEVDTRNDGIIYEQCDIDADNDIPFPGVVFDVIVCSEVIEHLFAPDHVFAIASNRLSSEGMLLITTPNLGVWFNRIALFLGYQPCFSEVSTQYNVGKIWTNCKEDVGGHLRMFTLRALVELGERHGFRTVHKASTRGGSGIVGWITNVLSVIPSLGGNLFCVFERRDE